MSSINVCRVSVVALAAILLSACTTTRPAEPWQCALAGAGVGALMGAGVGVNLDDDKNDSTAIGAGAGAAAGAIAGATICALMPKEQPPPPVAAPPPPKPAPVVVKTVVLPGVNFAFNRADLRPEARNTIDREIIPELRADPSMSVAVEGHTDAVGSDSYNQALSERRAASVKSYLESQGIDGSRIEAVGFGETRPIADNDTETGRAQNRRVEVKELK